MWRVDNEALQIEIGGIKFSNPLGLAAGFDYKAKLYRILPSLGFGFGTIGTITNMPYEGNPGIRLGRLIKSKSLLVNKGFKNDGIQNLTSKLKGKTLNSPVGLSVGPTNSEKIDGQEKATADILSAFRTAEGANLDISYYELNISCPNLFCRIDLYSPNTLEILIKSVSKMNLSKPLFVKMPISETNERILEMLEIISRYPVQGIIFGNLQHNREDKSFVEGEIVKQGKGNFSGKPTEKRSNELIALAYKNYGDKLTIVGCGGIFNAKDAYRKIRLGASLLQFITGLVFEGPQLPGEINKGLIKLLKQDGFNKLTDAIGIDVEE
jgi:dihydroorotate dehydrogenase subfamily 2